MKRTWMFAFFLMAAAGAASAGEVIATRLTPSSATIYFAGQLPEFTSSLSDDKRTLTLAFPSLAVPDSLRHVLGKSSIAEAYWQISGGAAKVFLRFDDKRGYTVARQPFSRALSVEIFRWADLSPAEDAYRNGLLAEESRADSSAVALYERAFAGGVAAAALRLGVLAGVAGNVESAADWLGKAREAGVRSPELTALSGYLARAKGDERAAEAWAEKFASQTGFGLTFGSVSDFPAAKIALLDGEPTPLPAVFDDEATAGKTTAANDLDRRFANLFGDKKHPENSGTSAAQSSLLPAWAKTGSLAAAAFFCTGGFYIGFMYFRWRSARLKRRRKRPATAESQPEKPAGFATEFNAALAQTAAAAYSAPQAIDRTLGDTDEPQYEQQKEVAAPKSQSATRPKPAGTLPQKASVVAPRPQLPPAEPNSEIDALAGIFPPGEIQLAMRLHSRRRAHKDATLLAFAGDDVPDEAFRLSQTARSLGVEQGGLELKKHLGDEGDHLARLYRKFGARTN